MSSSQLLKSVSIFERDVNQDVIPWSYPSLSVGYISVLSKRANFISTTTDKSKSDTGTTTVNEVDSNTVGFHFSKYKSNWQYFMTTSTVSSSDKVTDVCIAIVSTLLNPIKFFDMLKLFLSLYLKECSVLPVLTAFMSIFTTGKTENDVGKYDWSSYVDKKALISPVKHIVNKLGAEVIAVWVAILLKKRVFVYCSNIAQLTEFIRSFPLFGGWHRQNWNMLRPYISSMTSEDEIKDMQTCGAYVAGFTDPSCVNKSDMYDLFVDLNAGGVTIAKHASTSFKMSKFHKQLASHFLKANESGNDQDIIKAIAVKTKELIDNIKTLCSKHENGETFVTLPELQEKGLPANMDTFFYEVAIAEGLAKK